ncbi:MAG: N-acyl amino acid synthase FeeM domain-containing protein [Alphaproteobacteria bacterium]
MSQFATLGVTPEDWAACQSVRVHPANSLRQLEKAYRLVYNAYLECGYVRPDETRMRLSVYNALPDSVTIVGTLGGAVISTVTVVPDSLLMLPMDEIYAEELAALRDKGRSVVEVTMLADRRRQIRRAVPMVLRLMKHVFDYATQILHADDLCITVHPSRQGFYRKYLLFSEFGKVKNYPSVRDNPAVAMRLPLDKAEELCRDRPRLRELFFEDRVPPEVFQNRYRLSPADVAELFVKRTDILRNASSAVLDYIQQQYPQSDLRTLFAFSW